MGLFPPVTVGNVTIDESRARRKVRGLLGRLDFEMFCCVVRKAPPESSGYVRCTQIDPRLAGA